METAKLFYSGNSQAVQLHANSGSLKIASTSNA